MSPELVKEKSVKSDKLKLGQLVNSSEAFARVLSAPVPMSIRFQLKTIRDKFQPKLKLFQEVRLELCKKYGESEDEENWTIKPENVKEFNSELNELLETPVDDLNIKKINEVYFGDNLSVFDVDLLNWLIILAEN